ncbi:MAG: hypothetical protein CMC14_05670 [Flavobacteriaceae bacterium]|nr:hypothetical protein [Flavobacteriaceae bacterium]|tara:strand:+ start:64041 stop:65639 length:1599 start_codon:yes stop_codon:yes gene_type:complete
MKITNVLPKLGVLLLVIVAFASCEEDFSNLDTNIINENFTSPDTTFSVVAYSKLLGGIQTNGLSSYKLGVYNDPVYGKTISHFLGQMVLSTANPTFPVDSLDPVLERVVLHLPYFSTSSTDSDDVTTYTLDSIFGSAPTNISVYESNYFLRDTDPDSNFEDQQKYYSNQGPLFQSNLGQLLATKNAFVPSSDEIELIFEDIDTIALPPGLLIDLPVDFFQQKIIDQEGEEVLINNNNFKNYFRGLFLEASADGDGNTFIFSTEDAKVTLYYSSETTSLDSDGNQQTDDDGNIIRLLDSYDLNFSGINVNVFNNNLPASITTGLANSNSTLGDETLYIRGGEGIVTIIDLFGGDDNQNGVNDLEELREKEWLINEANLIFYVDQDKVSGGSFEPERIMVFDPKNNTILADYSIDLTTNNSAVNAVTQHLGRLERDSDENGEYYKIKLTSHVSNLINRDSTNISLGLMVSQNVSLINFRSLENELSVNNPDVESLTQVPASCVISPEGTVLHGNRSSNQEKRLKLQLFYTEPNN